MDGIESTRQIRELGFKAPIVALTAFDHETNRNACFEAGMNGKFSLFLSQKSRLHMFQLSRLYGSRTDHPLTEFLPKPIRRTALKKILEQFRPDGPGGEKSPT